MKYSQFIGIAAALAMIIACFFPWSFIASKQLVVSGMHAVGTNFGRPGLFNIALCAIMVVLFAIPAVWAKRTNVFLAALNLAWAFRNFLLISTCMMGECPEKRPALFVLLGLAVIVQVMVLLPRIELPEK
ncbi:MAG: hypothetical protein JWQ78_1818 [Sediminibacterium sp.]|nr:hypothetical protein [Sediminibacterium sp.]